MHQPGCGCKDGNVPPPGYAQPVHTCSTHTRSTRNPAPAQPAGGAAQPMAIAQAVAQATAVKIVWR